MPKFVQHRCGPLGWLLVASALAGVACFAAIEPKAFSLALSVFVALGWFARKQTLRQQRQLLALASQRDGQTICQFARDFDARALDTWVIRAVYEQLQVHLKHAHPTFPLRADDLLKEHLLLDEDELDMGLAVEIEARTGRLLRNTGSNPHFGKVRTVRDLVLFFQNQPRLTSTT